MNPSQRSRRHRLLGPLRATAVVAALLLMLAACSDTAQTATDSAEAGTDPATTSTVDPTTMSPAPEAKRLDALDSGDAVSPGRWATGALATPASFEVASSLVLLEESRHLVALGTPEPGVSQSSHALVLLNPGGVIVFDGSQPAEAPFPADLGRWLDESPTVEVTDSGAIPGGSWWDIATSGDAVSSTPCQFGDRCVEWLVLANGSVSVVSEQEDWRFRVFELDPIGDEPLLMLAQARAGSFDELVDLGETIVATAEAEPRSDFPEAEAPVDAIATMATIIGREPLPPGDYRQELRGIGALRLMADAPLDVVVGEASEGGVAFFDTFAGPPGAFVIFTDDPLVDPVDAAAAGVDHGTTDERDVGTWAGLVAGITLVAQGDIIIGGQAAEWWDLGIDPDAPDEATTPCDFDPSRRCVHLVEEGPAVLDIAEGSTTRVHVFQGIGLKLFVQANDRNPEAPALDEILGRFQPLFDGLTFET